MICCVSWSSEAEGLRAHSCLIVLIKVMCCLFQEPELETSDMGCEGFEDAEILGICIVMHLNV